MVPVQAPADDAGRVKPSAVEPPDQLGGAARSSEVNGYGSRPHAHSRSAQPPEQGSHEGRHGSPQVAAEEGVGSVKVGAPGVQSRERNSSSFMRLTKLTCRYTCVICYV